MKIKVELSKGAIDLFEGYATKASIGNNKSYYFLNNWIEAEYTEDSVNHYLHVGELPEELTDLIKSFRHSHTEFGQPIKNEKQDEDKSRSSS